MWFYIDTQNVAQLYKTAHMHAAYQLSRVCEDFIFRNYSKVFQCDGFSELDEDDQNEIKNLVKEKEKQKMSQKKKEEEEVNSQGQHAERIEDVRAEGMMAV